LPRTEGQTHLLVTPVGLEHVFDRWKLLGGFSDWRVVEPVVVGLDAERVARGFYEELVSSITGTYLRIVGSGDAAHLCVRLLSHASDGRCALIDPPVVSLLRPADQDEMLEAGMQVVSEMPNRAAHWGK
jgi:hypothetical protein